MKRKVRLPLSIVYSFFLLTAFVPAQIAAGQRSTFSPPGSIGSPGAIKGRGGLRGRGVNPNFNPPGSLSAIERLTPRGSISGAYNLNPQGSIFRPRSATPIRPPRNPPGSTSSYSAARPVISGAANGGRARALRNDAQWALSDVRLLQRELRRYENGRDWIEALKLNELTNILQDGSDGNLTTEERSALSAISHRLEQLRSDRRYTVVTQLRGFEALAKQLRDLPSARPTNDPEHVSVP